MSTGAMPQAGARQPGHAVAGAQQRAKEGSIRLALGASRWQLVRHLLTESVVLAAAGEASGCIVAWWGIRAVGVVDLPIAVVLLFFPTSVRLPEE